MEEQKIHARKYDTGGNDAGDRRAEFARHHAPD